MRLRRPLPLQAAQVRALRAEFTLAELGGFLVLAVEFWPDGRLPTSTRQAAALLETRPSIAKRMLADLGPLFAPGGPIGALRAAHIVKAGRRARAGKLALAARVRTGVRIGRE